MDQPTMDLGTNGMTYDIYDFANSHDLDFLTNRNGHDQDDSTMVYEAGLELGIDQGHHWGNGTQLDLFDGFFFGNVGNSA